MSLEIEPPNLPGLPSGQRWRVMKSPVGYVYVLLEEHTPFKVGIFRRREEYRWIEIDRASVSTPVFPSGWPFEVQEAAEYIVRRRKDKEVENRMIEVVAGIYESRKI